MQLSFVVLLLTAAISFVAALPFDSNREQPRLRVTPRCHTPRNPSHPSLITNNKGSTYPNLKGGKPCAGAKMCGGTGKATRRRGDSVHTSKYWPNNKPRQFLKRGGAFSTMSLSTTAVKSSYSSEKLNEGEHQEAASDFTQGEGGVSRNP
ncbi:BQ5605_C006g04041 [Microbotryum silenes-dioicae]|uniref:BQ5605_C006g04041 protein n=1 Tax=Microbotryum silenes-dioicae TaxID=796604 RepID=A0A2X0P877_9BASI|nr:BQ5605_C006g04041 [Microbotryum silenes-dioicae]